MLESIGVRPRPAWVRGPARVDGGEIVLDGGAAEQYAAFDPEHATRLLLDLGNLGKLGERAEGEQDPDARLIDTIQMKDTGRALEFAETHGLLWHGPDQVGAGEVRESLKDWFLAGLELSLSTAMYSCIGRPGKEKSAEPVRSYLRLLRDAGFFKRISLPDDDNDLLEYSSIQLAERVSRGMAGCRPTLSAACGLLEDGKKVGVAGDFRIGNEPDSLVGAANYQLAHLISLKKEVKDCEECGEMFFPEDPRRRYHPKCGARKRQRERRAKLAGGQ